jgi:hypothetical protein
MGFRNVFRRQATEESVFQVDVTTTEDSKRDIPADGVAAENNGAVSADQPVETPEEELHRGVHDIEAMTKSWSKGALIAVFLKYASPSVIVVYSERDTQLTNFPIIVSGCCTSQMRSKARSSTA